MKIIRRTAIAALAAALCLMTAGAASVFSNGAQEELGSALGLNACALAALTDAPLALAFVEALGEPERHQAILETLRTQTARIEKRRKEEKAHRNNVRRGKK